MELKNVISKIAAMGGMSCFLANRYRHPWVGMLRIIGVRVVQVWKNLIRCPLEPESR